MLPSGLVAETLSPYFSLQEQRAAEAMAKVIKSLVVFIRCKVKKIIVIFAVPNHFKNDTELQYRISHPLG